MMMMSEQPSLSSSEQQQEVANDDDDDDAIIDLSRISAGWLQPKRRSQDIEATEILWRREEEKDDSENDDVEVEVEVENDHRSTSSSTLLQQAGARRNCSSICGVCKQNISRYKCPRCSIPYCSIECYKNHSIPEESNSINKNNLVSSSCTEEFYGDRVSSILQLEVQERKDSFSDQILKRRNHSSSILGNDNDDNNNNNNNGIAEIVDDDVITKELYDLLLALENNNNDYENTESTNIFKQKLSPTLRAMLEFDISKGTILQELGIIKKWHPWWRQELHISNNHIMIENEEEERIYFEKPNQTLDERLLDEVQDWTKIKRPNRNTVTSRNNINGNSNSSLQQQQHQQQPSLIYNTIDILYGICWTLRLYHGIDNAISIDSTAATTTPQKATTTSTTSISSCSNMALDASETLLDSSTVLGTDARYYTLEQCLMVNTKASTTAASAMIRQSNTTNMTTTDIGGSGNGNVNNNFTEWKLLVEDCALICQSKRMIGRALLEGKDLINAAIKQLKLLLESKKKQEEEEVIGEEGEEESFRRLRRRQYLSRLRLVKKKIDFYLSYSQSLEPNEIELIRIALIDWAEYWSSSSPSSSP